MKAPYKIRPEYSTVVLQDIVYGLDGKALAILSNGVKLPLNAFMEMYKFVASRETEQKEAHGLYEEKLKGATSNEPKTIDSDIT